MKRVRAVAHDSDFGGPALRAHRHLGGGRPLLRKEVEEEFSIVLFGGVDFNHSVVLVLTENGRHAVFVGRTDAGIGGDFLLLGLLLGPLDTLLLVSFCSEQGVVQFLEACQEPPIG